MLKLTLVSSARLLVSPFFFLDFRVTFSHFIVFVDLNVAQCILNKWYFIEIYLFNSTKMVIFYVTYMTRVEVLVIFVVFVIHGVLKSLDACRLLNLWIYRKNYVEILDFSNKFRITIFYKYLSFSLLSLTVLGIDLVLLRKFQFFGLAVLDPFG